MTTSQAGSSASSDTVSDISLTSVLPEGLRDVTDPDTLIPKLARAPARMAAIEEAVRSITTRHEFRLGDAREMDFLDDGSVHLVLTSPPYWTLKEYNLTDGQLGYVRDYEEFVGELDRVWRHAYRALVPGGRLVCVVGDVCLSRRRNKGRHTVVPLHSSIQEHGRQIGFDNVAPIIWHKIANAQYEVEGNGGGFLGKPYEPNAVVKNDIEFILMLRKPGGYRRPSVSARILSVISEENHRAWFQQIWQGLTGASTRHHPAPYPLALAERLVRMFSFVGDTILDPFMGTGTTNAAAACWGRNSVGVEVDAEYFAQARARMDKVTAELFTRSSVTTVP
jgi:DNA modification methylase